MKPTALKEPFNSSRGEGPHTSNLRGVQRQEAEPAPRRPPCPLPVTGCATPGRSAPSLGPSPRPSAGSRLVEALRRRLSLLLLVSLLYSFTYC